MTTATSPRLAAILGSDYEPPDYPVVRTTHRFVAHAPGAHDATAGSDDLRQALNLAWDGWRASEQPAYVWDLRGDGAEFDATAEPRLLYVVGAFPLGGEDD